MTNLNSVLITVLFISMLTGCGENNNQSSEEKNTDSIADTGTIKPKQTEQEQTQVTASDKAPSLVKPKRQEDKMIGDDAQRGPVILTGTIVYKDLEGGFYALITSHGKKYTLKGLPEEFKQDGLAVKVTGRLLLEAITITQFGTLMEVTAIEKADDII